MAKMANRFLTWEDIARRVILLSVLVSSVVYLVVPVGLVLSAATGDVRAGGFGLGSKTLAALALSSLLFSLVPALAGACFCVAASCMAYFMPLFSRSYRVLLLVLLFTNPIFLVFGFSVLFSQLSPGLAVMLATWYLLLPLVGLITQGSFDEFPTDQVIAARALGATPLKVCLLHLIPGVRKEVLAASLLGSFYALGFYLVPAFVGLGRVTTLGTAIDHAANQTGDWAAASQLAALMLLSQFALILVVKAMGLGGAWARTLEG